MEDTLRARNNYNFINNKSLNPCFNGRYSQSVVELRNFLKVLVLILVLMEDTLRVPMLAAGLAALAVLILVLMEDTLRDVCRDAEVKTFKVLILVLMEDTLREKVRVEDPKTY